MWQALGKWLASTRDWILVLDGLDDEAPLRYLARFSGIRRSDNTKVRRHLLVTTRLQSIAGLPKWCAPPGDKGAFRLLPLCPDDAAELLLHGPAPVDEKEKEAAMWLAGEVRVRA
jgi:hypothetical protein